MGRMLHALAYFTATFAYAGRFPFASGTAGSAASLMPLMAAVFLLSPTAYAVVLPIGVLVFIAAGIPAASYVERAEKREDPGCVVIDEAAGQWLTFLFLPAPLLIAHPWLFAAGFVLFRVFDIWKPFPVRQAEALPGGLGIMADDIAAGLYACVVLNVIARFALL